MGDELSERNISRENGRKEKIKKPKRKQTEYERREIIYAKHNGTTRSVLGFSERYDFVLTLFTIEEKTSFSARLASIVDNIPLFL